MSAEGLLEEDEENAVRRHVLDCATCAEQQAGLAEVSRVLAEVPAPPLPEALAARLDDALRAEGEARRAGGTGTAPATDSSAAVPGASNVVPMRRRGFGANRWVNYLAVAAAAVVVVGGGTAVLNGMTMDSGAGAPPAASAPSGEVGGDTALSYQPLLVSTGTVYTEAELATQAQSVLTENDPTSPDGAEGDAEGPADANRPDPSAVPSEVSSCAHRLGPEAGGHPLLIDFAEFDSGSGPEAAWAMYFGTKPGGGTQKSYEVVVVPEGCSGDDPVLARSEAPAP
ncbi:anti-sigma factor family protein [Streptomonospora nanhaiensis]|uniref:Zinc-finger domain-containing protein n=1 Tax=Streptomonospora nanhaiensis TaxID=1323731 RepID=A0A853BRA0_9ACTN|nr:hypothetical protein [Streptomonospora nanhaiensis]NYI97087.1 hypothetical protein [Streptomonospora nanhaiensis]